MAERLSPRIYLRFHGRGWRVLVTYGALLDCEGAAGVEMLTAGEEVGRPSGRLLRAWLWAVLKRAGAEYSLVQAGALLTPRNHQAVHGALLRGWVASMPEPSTEGERGKALGWLECWALATSRDGLHLSDEAWLGMTPRLVHALSEQRLEAMRQGEYMLSKVAAAAANWGPHAPKPAIKDEYFMTHPWPVKKPEEQGASMGDEFMKFVGRWKQWNRQTT